MRRQGSERHLTHLTISDLTSPPHCRQLSVYSGAFSLSSAPVRSGHAYQIRINPNQDVRMSSASDRAILNSIFNPLLPVGECVYEENIPEELKDSEEATPKSEEAKHLELEGVKLAEVGNVEEAMTSFNKAIELAPQRASSFNNRAQAFRLMGKVEEAMTDLDTAVRLSEGKGRAACQAFTQRAMIHRLHGQDDLARADFQEAANLGSEFAKAQVVQMNPYAALCNKMLHDVFTKLRRGECEAV
ncbi:tetratricopeptide repeat protein 36-like [Eriocheir sinensis]|uniref:tetratricopeptide repeat protein 36-like n=1 Tax=Eriocheir sinensis TaxID=95602 RepID=UPI0021C585D8|nr:tetratricopeptide repeat protein 36-like [Eriocheir sinensis]